MRRLVFGCVLFLLFFRFISLSMAEENVIKNDDPKFEMSMPDYFEAFTSDQLPQGWDAGYSEKTGFEDKQPITIGIEILNGVLDRPYQLDIESVKKEFPIGAQLEKVYLKSLGFKLEGLRVIISSGEFKSVIYIVQIPVKPKAIGIIIGGIAQREDEIKQILQNMLNSLKAQSNWLSERQASTRLGQGIGRLIIFLIAMIVLGRVFSLKKGKKNN